MISSGRPNEIRLRSRFWSGFPMTLINFQVIQLDPDEKSAQSPLQSSLWVPNNSFPGVFDALPAPRPPGNFGRKFLQILKS